MVRRHRARDVIRGDLRKGDALGLAGSGPHPAGQGVDRGRRGAHEIRGPAAEVGEHPARFGPITNPRLRTVKAMTEQEAGSLHGSEEIGNAGERGPFHVLVEDGRRSGRVGAALDLGDFEVSVHFVRDPDQHPVPLQVGYGVGEGPVGCGHDRSRLRERVQGGQLLALGRPAKWRVGTHEGYGPWSASLENEGPRELQRVERPERIAVHQSASLFDHRRGRRLHQEERRHILLDPTQDPVGLRPRNVTLPLAATDRGSGFDPGDVQDDDMVSIGAFGRANDMGRSFLLDVQLEQRAGVEIDARHRQRRSASTVSAIEPPRMGIGWKRSRRSGAGGCSCGCVRFTRIAVTGRLGSLGFGT